MAVDKRILWLTESWKFLKQFTEGRAVSFSFFPGYEAATTWSVQPVQTVMMWITQCKCLSSFWKAEWVYPVWPKQAGYWELSACFCLAHIRLSLTTLNTYWIIFTNMIWCWYHYKPYCNIMLVSLHAILQHKANSFINKELRWSKVLLSSIFDVAEWRDC